MSIAVVLMVKNEAARIEYTIRSCDANHVDGIIVFDTGSTDETLDIIEREAKVPVHVKKGEFIDFATSRNECLDFANEVAREHGYEYFFLIDANDELIFEENFKVPSDESFGVWLVDCRWNIRNGDTPMRFKNTKFVKANVDIRWVGVVHEYLNSGNLGRGKITGVSVFQDRVKDADGKSRNRWDRDRILLEKEHEKHPDNERTIFYLAQTYACIGNNKLAYEFYEKRAAIDGFREEKYTATYRCGEHALLLKMDDYVAVTWFLKAFTLMERAEPLLSLSRIFSRMKQYKLAHVYAKLACEVDFPEKALLFVDSDCYSYGRWHQLGIVSWYAGKYEDGKLGCNEALKAKDKQIDRQNLEFYQKDF